VFNSEEKISENIDLNLVIENIKNIDYKDNISIDIANKDISINVLLKIPSIKNEMVYDEEVSKLFKKTNDIKTDDDVKTLVTEAFISEASKYISKIFISSQEINFEVLTLKQKIQITERLSSTIMQKILESVSEWKTILDTALEVKYKEYTTNIKIDSILFLN
jgi:exonuclease I